MLKPGDIVDLELGIPTGSEAGLHRPAVVVTAGQILRGNPNVVHVVPLTRTIRTSRTEILLEPDSLNNLQAPSMVQCQHIRAVATSRVQGHVGNVGTVVLSQIREILRIVLDT